MKIEALVHVALCSCTAPELAQGYVRYEALRKLTPRRFAELHKRCLAGEHFDTMVNELAEKGD